MQLPQEEEGLTTVQTSLDITKLQPLGTHILLKKEPEQTHVGRLEIPEEYRDRNNLKGMLYTGIAIAVGNKTKAARYGRDRGWFEPGDRVFFWHMYDWKDRDIVLKDEASGDEYLMVDEKDVHAYEVLEAA